MSDQFLPFRPAGTDGLPKGPVSTRVKILARPESVISVQPKAFSVQKKAAPPSSVPGPTIVPHPVQHCAEPRVQIQRDGDKITRIQIHCSCGQVMDLDCVY
jgi:hypothetical protein